MLNFKSIHDYYVNLGVNDFYQLYGSIYVNPHENIVRELITNVAVKNILGKNVLDLCCGSGEITLSLTNHNVVGVDPYTKNSYFQRTGKYPLNFNFKDIAVGKLQGNYDSIVCSYALHLCPTSLLPIVLWNLKIISKVLVIITPHKRPECDGIFNWFLVDEVILKKIRMKIYLTS